MESATATAQDPGARLRAARSVCELFQATALERAAEPALRTAGDGRELSWAEYREAVREIAGGLAGLGVGRGDSVALMMLNRHEFALADCAAMHLGATPFSVYNTFPVEVIHHLLANSGCRVAICEERFAETVGLAAAGTSVERVVCVDAAPAGTISLEDLPARARPDFDFEAAWRAVGPEDVLTLIYTSGTTGPPKGVELTHANMLAQLRGMAHALPLKPGGRTVSYLPSAHIADRWSSLYTAMAHGLSITYVPDPAALGATVAAVKPTVWGGVPRVFEKMRAGLEAALSAEPDPARRAAAQAALQTGREVLARTQEGAAPDPELAARHEQADRMVLAPLRARLGLDEAEWLAIGAAPAAPEMLEFFCAIGLPLCEVWGMSELSCVCTTNRVERMRIGTVGLPIEGAELRLAEDGELLVRGPLVTRGYRGEPEKTAEAIDPEGWLHTGDIGKIDADGFVSIVDRKKELIINSAGKNMSPANIESHLKSAHPAIGQAVCIGDRRPYNVALLVLEPEALAAWAARHDLADVGADRLARDERLLEEIGAAVRTANENLARVEQIKRWLVLGEEWLPGGEELTPTMKLRRTPIARKYAAEIERLYEQE
ncbi:MAG TPA: AMP-dependent synthetase/ligase [Solirubrobacteraceae bacterium]|nr:AMP-dependent synthetase/ligase [Solirubrobacteraceae bacterium]